LKKEPDGPFCVAGGCMLKTMKIKGITNKTNGRKGRIRAGDFDHFQPISKRMALMASTMA
jgi:hypothetical protein